jgi:hypothetical protein
VGAGEVDGYRPDLVAAEHAVTADNKLELILPVEMRVGGAAGVLFHQECHGKQRIGCRVGRAGRHVVARRAQIQRVPERHAVSGGASEELLKRHWKGI